MEVCGYKNQKVIPRYVGLFEKKILKNDKGKEKKYS